MRQSISIITAGILLLLSCGNKDEGKKPAQAPIATVEQPQREPRFDFTLTAPAGWRMTDTTVEGLHLRLVRCPPAEVASGAVLNVVAVHRGDISLDTFTQRNMTYLQTNMEGVVIGDKGSFTASGIEGRWFAYTKVHNGQKREMVNYIIPVGEFAYMLTAGSNEGTMNRYRVSFDDIAGSFKMP